MAVLMSEGRPIRIALLMHDHWYGNFKPFQLFLQKFKDNFVVVTPVPQIPGHPTFEKILKKNWRQIPFKTLIKLGMVAVARKSSNVRTYFGGLPEYAGRLLVTLSINENAYIRKLREFNLDIIVSYGCHQIFKENLLQVPKIGCINVHPGHLPRYKGPSPLFCTLLNHETSGAVSIHEMVPGVDDGQVIEQGTFPIKPLEDSLWDLGMRVPAVAIPLLERALVRIANRSIVLDKKRIQAGGEYHSWPKPEEIARFFQSGCKLI